MPYRTLENLEANPAQEFSNDRRLGRTLGDDSLLWSPRPIRYRGDTPASRMKAAEAARQGRFDERHESVWSELFPIPERSRDINSARVAETIARIEKQKAKAGKRRKAYGASSSPGYFGASR